MLNNSTDNEWCGCVDEKKGNCPYMKLNEYGTETCSIDHIVQVRWYGCIPQEVINKINKQNEVRKNETIN